jgi:hypothetical protein
MISSALVKNPPVFSFGLGLIHGGIRIVQQPDLWQIIAANAANAANAAVGMGGYSERDRPGGALHPFGAD